MSYSETRAEGVAAYVQATGRDAYWTALEEQRARFVDAHGALRAELVEDASCAVCGPAEARPVFEKDGFSYLRCLRCGSIFIGRQLRDEVLEDFWSNAPVVGMWLDVLLTPAQLEFDRAKFESALERVEERLGRTGALLDVGCSVGTFLDVARSRGWSVSGVEPGRRARELARAKYDLHVDEDLDAVAGSRFDLVSFWEVVEHTKQPREVLRQAAGLIADEGIVLALVGGNAGSIANRIMRAASAAFDFARPWYFTPSSFETLLESAGLRSVEVEGVLQEVDTAVNYLRYDDPYSPVFDETVLPETIVAALESQAANPELAYKFLSLASR
jgi:hypothetical protein